jgi:hypothetical protein
MGQQTITIIPITPQKMEKYDFLLRQITELNQA